MITEQDVKDSAFRVQVLRACDDVPWRIAEEQAAFHRELVAEYEDQCKRVKEAFEKNELLMLTGKPLTGGLLCVKGQ